MAKTKGNKDVLNTVNDSMNIIKKIKSNEIFTDNEKMEIMDKYVGVSDTSNNSYWTPFEICDFIKKMLPMDMNKEIHMADLSAGIGNMARPFIQKYGKLEDNIKFDLYEFNTDTSMALAKAWEDFGQVKVFGDCDTLNTDIENDKYDFIIGNPPFAGNCEYKDAGDWARDSKGKAAKSLSIMDAFVDLAIQKCKNKGYIAYIIAGGHLYKSNKTAKLRAWMRDRVALKAVIPLDSDTFNQAGITGTSIGSYLIILQKGTKQDKVFLGELCDKSNIKTEMSSMAKQFKLLNSGNYDVGFECDNGIKHGKLSPKVIWSNSNEVLINE